MILGRICKPTKDVGIDLFYITKQEIRKINHTHTIFTVDCFQIKHTNAKIGFLNRSKKKRSMSLQTIGNRLSAGQRSLRKILQDMFVNFNENWQTEIKFNWHLIATSCKHVNWDKKLGRKDKRFNAAKVHVWEVDDLKPLVQPFKSLFANNFGAFEYVMTTKQ